MSAPPLRSSDAPLEHTLEKSPDSGTYPVVDTPTNTPGVPHDEYQASMSDAAVIPGPTCCPSTTHPVPDTSDHESGTATENQPLSSLIVTNPETSSGGRAAVVGDEEVVGGEDRVVTTDVETAGTARSTRVVVAR